MAVMPKSFPSLRTVFRSHQPTQVLVLFIFLLSLQLIVAAPPKCSDLPTPAPATEEACPNGVVIDWCNRPVCGKGPGQSCGGRWNEFGQCGSGMFCGCDVCQGCNKRVECFLQSKC